MKILVGIKRVIDYTVHIRIKADGRGVETQNVKMSMNPFDAIALEEAIRLKERSKEKNEEENISEIIVVSIGTKECQETLRQALAMGADRGILIEVEEDKTKNLESFHIAKILKKIVEKEKPDLILLGKQAIDDDCNQTGQMLAGLLDYPQGCFISKLDVDFKNQKITATRELDDGLEIIEMDLPAVITTDLRLNEPRFATLPNIMRSKQKVLENFNIKDLLDIDIDLNQHIEILNISEPPKRKSGVILNSVDQLMDKLIHEAKVL